ncbi:MULTISPECIES: hypothetical protein [Shouchella]|nr:MULTISPECIES: hypothetical protein [Bacillaceae]
MKSRDQHQLYTLHQMIWCATSDGERKRCITKLALLQAQLKAKRG